MFFFSNYFVPNIYLMDKDCSLAMQSRQVSGAPCVLSVEWEELPALLILPWIISKQVNCFKTTDK